MTAPNAPIRRPCALPRQTVFHGKPIGKTDIDVLTNEFANARYSGHLAFAGITPPLESGPANGRIVMKSFLKSCTALTVALSFSGQALAQVKEIGEGEGQVNIVAWAGYIERGETDKNFDWVTKFEEATGCKVNVKTANTSDEMVALMNEGGFDLVTASGDASLRLIAGKRVQPINIDLIKSWGTVDDRLKDAPWHTVDGVHYGVPYMWGPNVLMYNTNVFKEAPKSWSVVFEETNLPDGKSNKGRVQAYDGPIHVADAALYLMKRKPELGINTRPPSTCFAPSARWSAATGMTPSSRSTISRTRASSPPARGRSRSICSRAKSSRSPPYSRRKGSRAGPIQP
jgi:hypothetical protein